ncbi:MAG: phytanoyl-CoA dioxygenase family protein [Burkholderiales bacterium]|nr:phytanoyl-CoA dioxygenase family protein [Burkholderiales bacterium]
MATLSPEEAAHYQREGYVIPRFRLPAERMQALVAALDKLIADNPGVRPEKLVSAHVERKPGQGLNRDGKNDEGVQGSKVFLDLAMDPDILDLVEAAIGPDIILWGAHVFCKPAREGYETPWHQDGHYWPMRPLATCTVWVALEESVLENGCLKVIPRSHAGRATHAHLREDRDDLTLTMRTRDDLFDPADEVALELQPGQMSMHDVYLIHGAAKNTSGKRRTGIALRYMPGTSVFERNISLDGTGVSTAFATRPLWLLRGQDRTGRNDFKVGHWD